MFFIFERSILKFDLRSRRKTWGGGRIPAPGRGRVKCFFEGMHNASDASWERLAQRDTEISRKRIVGAKK